MFRIASRANTKRVVPRLSTKLLNSSRLLSTFELPENKILETIKEDNTPFEGLFSNKAINELYFERGQHLVDELNRNLEASQVTGDLHFRGDLSHIISKTMNNANLYQINKNASHLHSLEFFFDALKPAKLAEGKESPIQESNRESIFETPRDQAIETNMDPELVSWIEHSFGSVQEFRNLLINSAMGIKGDGVVWLVAESSMSKTYLSDEDKGLYHNLALVNTYNGGVIDGDDRSGQMGRFKKYLSDKEAENKGEEKPQEQLEMEQEEEQSEEQEEVTEEQQKEESKDSSDPLSLGSVEDAEYGHAFHDKKFVPALSIDASPRNYLLDYGVYGKQKYLENLWECIDWSIVSRRLPPRTKQAISNF